MIRLILLALFLAACGAAPSVAQSDQRAYQVYRDGEHGAVVYIFPNGNGRVFPYTATPDSVTPAPLTPTPGETPATPAAVTVTPSAAPPTATASPPVAVALVNGGFESGSTGWLTYPLGPSVTFNVEDTDNGAKLVDSGRYSLRVTRDEFSAQPPIMRGGVMGRLTGLTPGQTVTVSCRMFGVQGSTDPFLNNAIRTIYSQVRLGFNAVGFGATNDPQVLRSGAQTVWTGAGLDYQWTTVTVSGVVFAAQVPVFVEFQIGQEWSAFPFAAAVVDSCAATAR